MFYLKAFFLPMPIGSSKPLYLKCQMKQALKGSIRELQGSYGPARATGAGTPSH